MKGRRAVYLSRVDRERLERGEISAPEQAVHKDDPPAVRQPAPAEKKQKRLSQRDREILEERPPHWG